MTRLITVEDWQAKARRRLPRFVFDYLEGGAEREIGLVRNRRALERLVFLPRRLVDVSVCSMDTELFGSRLRSPLVVAPIGLSSLLWQDGDVALAKAAARAGIPFTLSTASTTGIQAVAKASAGEKWFQLYVLGERRIAESLLRQAREAAFKVLVVTVDVPLSGKRVRDLRNGFTFPLRSHPRLVADCLRHPRWMLQMLRGGLPRFANLSSSADSSGSALRQLADRKMDRGLTWKCLDWIRAHWSGPIVLKGILNPDDALRAADCGVQGIVLSNHGGRQLDSLPASVEVLAETVQLVRGKVAVLVDGGFRSGSDVLKALALGAKAVMVGRAVLYGLAAAGEEGAAAVLSGMQDEIEKALALIGIPSTGSLHRPLVLIASEAATASAA